MSEISRDTGPDGPVPAGAEPPAPLSSAPKKPRLWSAFAVAILGFPAAILFAIVVVVIYALAVYGIHAAADPNFAKNLPRDPAVLVVIVVAMEVGIGLAVLVPALLSPEPWYRRLGLVAFPGYGAKLPVLMLATFAVNFLLTVTLPHFVGEPSDYLMPLIQAFFESGVLSRLALIIAITVIAGFAEEIFFRGYFQRRLLQRWPVWLAIGVASVFFAIAHGSLSYAAYVFPLGVWLGVVAWRTGSVWCSTACHAFNNLVGVLMLYVNSSATAEAELPLPIEIGLVIVALGILAWGIVALRRPAASAQTSA